MHVFNKLAYYFTELGNLLEILGAVFIVIVPTAVLFFFIGYCTRQMMEPIRVRYALAEKKEALHKLHLLHGNIQSSLAMMNKADIKEARVKQDLHVIHELRQLSIFRLLRSESDE